VTDRDELSELLAGLSNEELKSLGADIGVSIDLPAERPSLPDDVKEKAGFVRASSLVRDPDALDVGDYEPGPNEVTLYKSFPIIPRSEWPDVADVMPDPKNGVVGHANQKGRFYVRSPKGTIGLVPWDGSQVVWPWDAAWAQDMYRPQVESLLKEEPKKKAGK